ncbi:MAG: hypothetical protein A2048_01320 [Deltaproteobacteria bacterium GWA2_45_12]|nr:MAG: hypothetical protein A2048_01320 [Deltaproteobacteria bacterium GWA2_45_12]
MIPSENIPPIIEPPWLEIAREEIGVCEIPGSKNNPRIIEYGQATVLKATNDETPWCSAFVNWCFAQVGIEGTRSAAARSWIHWGDEIKEPVLGCVCVLKRGLSLWQGHVGFFIGKVPTNHIQLLGGNQGNTVRIEAFPANRVLSYRIPTERKVA